jgi:hypothetical protein
MISVVLSLSSDVATTGTSGFEGLGRNMFAFSQTSPNPTISGELASSSSVRMNLLREMFDPMVRKGDTGSDIYGGFEMLLPRPASEYRLRTFT